MEEELKCSVPSHNKERLSEETTGGRSPDGPTTHQEPKLLDFELFRKEAGSGAETDLQATPSHSRSEKSCHELHVSCNIKLAAEPTLESQ